MALDVVNSNRIRQSFTDAMSTMYRQEVPAYADLVDLVDSVNEKVMAENRDISEAIKAEGGTGRLRAERHGAIRIGKPEELNILRRAFAVMGMYPVGYYDLSIAGLPVHSTAFRPIDADAIAANPFRIFTSLLRLEQIENEDLRELAAATLAKRKIVSDKAIELIELAEKQYGLTQAQADIFVSEIVETFRWHSQARVDAETYQKLKAKHPLIADIVSFAGPHINHLTPRVLDIDEAQARMPTNGLNPKEVIEGPPRRKCPILLRQTSFKALNEFVTFHNNHGSSVDGEHTARFGEIEQRGIALTKKGHALYDRLLVQAQAGAGDVSYNERLLKAFECFPDDWDILRREGLAYFRFELTDKGNDEANLGGDFRPIEELIIDGLVKATPILYEDFLPISAAGIFRSNLSDTKTQLYDADANQEQFEKDMGCEVQDAFELYAAEQEASSRNVLCRLKEVGCVD